MRMQCRHRALMHNQVWSLLMTNISYYYFDGVLDSSYTSDVYINFPISELVGPNSQYVVAFEDYLTTNMDLVAPLYIIPRSHINTSNLNSVAIPVIEYISYIMDSSPKSTTISATLETMGMYTSISISPNFVNVSSTIANRRCYYINDASLAPLIGFQVYGYDWSEGEGGSGTNCEHTFELIEADTWRTCSVCGHFHSPVYQFQCTKCYETEFSPDVCENCGAKLA